MTPDTQRLNEIIGDKDRVISNLKQEIERVKRRYYGTIQESARTSEPMTSVVQVLGDLEYWQQQYDIAMEEIERLRIREEGANDSASADSDSA